MDARSQPQTVESKKESTFELNAKIGKRAGTALGCQVLLDGSGRPVRYGELTSLLQKAMRFNDAARAEWAAVAVWQVGFGTALFDAKLPTIALEDKGPALAPLVLDTVRAFRKRILSRLPKGAKMSSGPAYYPEAVGLVRRLARWMAELPSCRIAPLLSFHALSRVGGETLAERGFPDLDRVETKRRMIERSVEAWQLGVDKLVAKNRAGSSASKPGSKKLRLTLTKTETLQMVRAIDDDERNAELRRPFMEAAGASRLAPFCFAAALVMRSRMPGVDFKLLAERHRITKRPLDDDFFRSLESAEAPRVRCEPDGTLKLPEWTYDKHTQEGRRRFARQAGSSSGSHDLLTLALLGSFETSFDYRRYRQHEERELAEEDVGWFGIGKASYLAWDERSRKPGRSKTLAKTNHLLEHLVRERLAEVADASPSSSSSASASASAPASSSSPPSRVRPRSTKDKQRAEEARASSSGAAKRQRSAGAMQCNGLEIPERLLDGSTRLAQLPTGRGACLTFYDGRGNWLKGPAASAEHPAFAKEVAYDRLFEAMGFGARKLRVERRADYGDHHYLVGEDISNSERRPATTRTTSLLGGRPVPVVDPPTPSAFVEASAGAQSLSSKLYASLGKRLRARVFEAHLAKWMLGLKDAAHRNVMVDVARGRVYPIDADSEFEVVEPFRPKPVVKQCPGWLREQYLDGEQTPFDSSKIDQWWVLVKRMMPERLDYFAESKRALTKFGRKALFPELCEEQRWQYRTPLIPL